MIRRSIVAIAVSVCFVLSASVAAQKGGGSHRSSHGSSAKSGDASSKPVHIRTYTKKDGTVVEEHDRKAPEPRTASSGGDTTHASPPIRLIVDPVTGRKTFTNAPIDVEPLPTAATPSLTIPPAPPARSSATRSRVVSRSRVATAPSHASTAIGVSRTTNGRIARGEAAKHTFEVQTGYPHGRPGYVVDHIKPLACGGPDTPSNMQWQTTAAAKVKDKTERIGCR
jgi:hypothetical protein